MVCDYDDGDGDGSDFDYYCFSTYGCVGNDSVNVNPRWYIVVG